MIRAVTIFALTIASAFGADITGNWTGTWESWRDGQRRTGVMKFLFNQDRKLLTGHTFSKDGDPVSVRNGRIHGDAISFEVPDGDVTVKVNLKLEGDRLVGDAVRERDGKQQTMTLTCERDKK